nr:TetR family transcriptional regulator C-terminal domain-containing protein [Microbacterium laevaniformans]
MQQAALADAGRASAHAQRYRDSRDKLAHLVTAALAALPDRGHADGDPQATAELLHAAMLGLATQAVLDPAAHPPERLEQLVDTAIARAVTASTVAEGDRTDDSAQAQASGS